MAPYLRQLVWGEREPLSMLRRVLYRGSTGSPPYGAFHEFLANGTCDESVPPGTTYAATGTQKCRNLIRSRRRACSDIWFGVTNGSGISRLAEPPAEIHKATKSPGMKDRKS